eukprot:TRINITY_DN5678_c0_g1_i1.p1 TRINITY_DN5678_c0_g1~~TRINITY_DN5678_c0_g1_i1.p1  ORF type:complete len:184 (+),score=9.54 TRINITY_DN5678_c0_g1_i1:30-554(+)
MLCPRWVATSLKPLVSRCFYSTYGTHDLWTQFQQTYEAPFNVRLTHGVPVIVRIKHNYLHLKHNEDPTNVLDATREVIKLVDRMNPIAAIGFGDTVLLSLLNAPRRLKAPPQRPITKYDFIPPELFMGLRIQKLSSLSSSMFSRVMFSHAPDSAPLSSASFSHIHRQDIMPLIR